MRARALTPDAVQGRFDTVLLCVKAQHTEAAARDIAPHLADDGCIVSVQNGLNERMIARIVGPARTVGAFVNFGADYMEPGVVHYGGRGAVVLGEIDGRITPRPSALHALLLRVRAAPSLPIISGAISGRSWLRRDAVRHGADQRVDRRLPGAARHIDLCLRARLRGPVCRRPAEQSSREASMASIPPPSRRAPIDAAPGARSTRWWSTTAIPPNPIAASGATSRCASARPRPTRSLDRS